MINSKNYLRVIIIIVVSVAVAGGIWHWQSKNQLQYGGEDFKEKYSVGLERKQNPSGYEISENGPVLLVAYDLVFIDLETGEEKRFDMFKDLAHPEINSYLEEIPVFVQYNLYADILEWSEDGNAVLGSIDLFPSADPPIVVESSFFRITPGDWKIEKFQNMP